jgi:proline racemase
VVVRPGKIDRSPTGTGCSARMATLSARGLMGKGDVYRARSIIGSELICRIARPTTIGGRPAIIPAVSERAWITGVSQSTLDPAIRGPQATGFLTHGRALGSQFDRLARLVDAKPPPRLLERFAFGSTRILRS